MFSRKSVMKSTGNYWARIEKLKNALDDVEVVVVGVG